MIHSHAGDTNQIPRRGEGWQLMRVIVNFQRKRYASQAMNLARYGNLDPILMFILRLCQSPATHFFRLLRKLKWQQSRD